MSISQSDKERQLALIGIELQAVRNGFADAQAWERKMRELYELAQAQTSAKQRQINELTRCGQELIKDKA